MDEENYTEMEREAFDKFARVKDFNLSVERRGHSVECTFSFRTPPNK